MAYTTINKSSLFQNTKLYTGNSGTNAQTGVGFKPDWTWIKGRSTAYSHNIYDVVRGVTKIIKSNTNNTEDTQSTSLTAFGTDGFTLGSYDESNYNNATYASWNWKAGTSFSNSAGANGASIASTGSINTAAGFSIISYTGNGASSATLAHGLGAVPKMMIVKRRDTSASWFVYHQVLGANNQLKLDNQEASSANQGAWNNTAPTSSLFTIGTADSVNANNGTYIAYIFSEVTGYSKFGNYIGNGNADGTFVNLGFKPSFVLAKITDSNAEHWMLLDNKRLGYNPANSQLFPNTSDDEEANTEANFLSTGFKLTRANTRMNGSGKNYIFMAFGQSIVGTNNIPATAI